MVWLKIKRGGFVCDRCHQTSMRFVVLVEDDIDKECYCSGACFRRVHPELSHLKVKVGT